jgi:hypothetical protein
MLHNWGWIGVWGIIFGVHRCQKCGVVASEKSISTECQEE